MTKKKRITIYRVIIYLIYAVSIACSVFVFRSMAVRFTQTIADLYDSLKYYLQETYLSIFDIEMNVRLSVREIPEGVKVVLPIEWEAFKALAREFGRLIISGANISRFFHKILNIISKIVLILYYLLPILLPLIIVRIFEKDKIDNNYGQTTKSLRAFIRFEDKIVRPVLGAIKDFWAFVKEKKRFIVIFLVIWAWNLNVVNIVIEALAYLLFFFGNLGDNLIYRQIAKLAIDLVPLIYYVPLWLWLAFALYIVDKIRRKIGYKRLDKSEEHNVEFLEDHPGNYVITGKPRLGKTQTNNDMLLSQDVIFREKAHEKMLEKHLYFPFFKWDLVEQTVKAFRESILSFNIFKIRNFVKELESNYKAGNAEFLDKIKNLGYKSDDLLFNYDIKRYPTEYDNGLKIVTIWEAIRLYMEEYFIYTCPTPLIVGNFSIRSDYDYTDFGNQPQLNADFFRRTTRESANATKMSHLLIWDSMRLGKKHNADEPYQDAFDVGCAGITEAGKEYGNQITNSGLKTDADSANIKNDLSTVDLKMHSHGATIDNYTYFRVIMDEQRASSIMADITEIGQEVNIVKKSEPTILMPLYSIGELIYHIAYSRYKDYYTDYMTRHAGQTLSFYLKTKIFSWIYNHHTRIANTFSRYTLTVKIRDNSVASDTTDDDKYYICTKKTYSNRYDTTSFASYYEEKWSHSTVGGINQIPQYSTVRPTIDELRRTGSYNVIKLDKVFYKKEEESEKTEKKVKKTGKKPKNSKKAGKTGEA